MLSVVAAVVVVVAVAAAADALVLLPAWSPDVRHNSCAPAFFRRGSPTWAPRDF